MRKLHDCLGVKAPFFDKEGKVLHIGDKICYEEEEGYLLINPDENDPPDKEPANLNYYLVCEYSRWYGENVYTYDNYGKALLIEAKKNEKAPVELIENFWRNH